MLVPLDRRSSVPSVDTEDGALVTGLLYVVLGAGAVVVGAGADGAVAELPPVSEPPVSGVVGAAADVSSSSVPGAVVDEDAGAAELVVELDEDVPEDVPVDVPLDELSLEPLP